MRRITGAAFLLSSLILAGCITPPNKSPMQSTAPAPAQAKMSLAKPFKIIGHRGAAAYAPENTIASLEKAKSFGLYDVEIDIQLTKDGELVLFHDGNLSPKTAMKGKVRDYTWAQLQSAEIGTWFDKERGVPGQNFKGTKLVLLKDVFDKYADDFFYHVEIKADDSEIPAKLLALLNEKKVLDRVIVTSFYKDQLLRMRKLTPTLPLCYLIDDKNTPEIGTEIRTSKTDGFQQVAVRAPAMVKENVDLAHGLGLSIRAWGIKQREDMEKAIAAGAEGMTIDWPDWLVRELVKETR